MKNSYSILLGIGLLLSLGCTKENNNVIMYKVTSTPSGFDITYENSGGNTEQKTITSSSWTTSFTSSSGDFIYISAQADNKNATITSNIYFEGEIIETATSSGDYVIATASGSTP